MGCFNSRSPAPDPPFENPTFVVVLVEDDDTNMRIMEKAFSSHACEAHSARTGEEAKRIIDREVGENEPNKVLLLFTDNDLGKGMTGVDLCVYLSGKSIPSLACIVSGDADAIISQSKKDKKKKLPPNLSVMIQKGGYLGARVGTALSTMMSRYQSGRSYSLLRL